MGDALSSSQVESLIKLKELLQSNDMTNKLRDDEIDDKACLRWLKARKFNACKAFEMIKSYYEWKQTQQVDSYCLNSCSASIEMQSVVYMGEDRWSRPTFVVTPAKHVPSSVPIGQVQALMVLTLEVAIRNLKPDCDNFVVVFDYEGWGLKHVDKGVDNCLMSIGQNNYPERLKEAILVQPPWYFSTVWSVVKLFLDEATKNKVTFVKSKIREEMSKRFTPENLLEKYGGTSKGKTIKEYLTEHFQSNEETLDQYLNRINQCGL